MFISSQSGQAVEPPPLPISLDTVHRAKFGGAVGVLGVLSNSSWFSLVTVKPYKFLL